MQEETSNRKRKPLTQLSQAECSKEKRKKKTHDIERRAGVISRISLKNFMCHSFLEVNFTNNVTIIVGRNGSGKSAILTALIIGFGGKANLTNRGSSVKELVKTGKNSASIEIEISNEGPMAYKPTQFGKKITIIRNITATGGSSYKIKNENGAVVATQVKQVHNIATYLGIQIDNPICVLNQDTSRNFLNSSDPKQKFKLFMRATRLETLAEEYAKVMGNKRQSIKLFEEKNKEYNLLLENLDKLKIKIKNHKSLADLGSSLKELQIELLWSKVKDSEEEINDENTKMSKLNLEYNKIEECTDNTVEGIEKIQDNIRTLQQELREIEQNSDGQKRIQETLQKKIIEFKSDYFRNDRNKQLELNLITNKTKDVQQLQNEIDNFAENMKRREENKIRKLKELSELEEKLKSVEDHLLTCRNDLYQIKSDISVKINEEQSVKGEILQLENKINKENNYIETLRKDTSNNLLVYGRSIPKILEVIERYKHKFKHQPRGPLGSYIKIRDKKWAIAIESHLKPQLLGAFTVDNKNDNLLLNQIIANHWVSGKKPMIITSKFSFKKYDVRRNLLQHPPDCSSIYEMLDIEDAVVSNVMVNQRRIEEILLIPNNTRAQQLLSHSANVPRNCRQGITVEGDQYFPDPNYRSYGSRYHRAQYLQVDMQEYVRQRQEALGNLVHNKRALNDRLIKLRNDKTDQQHTIDELKEKVAKLTVAKEQINKKINECTTSAEPDMINVKILESECNELQNSIKEKTANVKNLEVVMNGLQDNIKENEMKLSKINESIKSMNERIVGIDGKIRECNMKQKELTTRNELDRRKKEEFKLRMKKVTNELNEKKKNLERLAKEAESLGARLDNLRPIPDIVKEMKEVERNVQKLRNETECLESLKEKYEELQIKVKQTTEIMNSLHYDVNELNLAANKRKRHYKLTETYFINYIKYAFKKMLEFRQFKGSINIDTENAVLDLVVCPQQTSRSVVGCTNLSGGERSFSTVAFLYSLWQCMDFPFYFLDEFDVYMDKLNRSKVLDILIHHASTKQDLQFVFLTPQDVSFIDKDVDILRLEDPKRHS